MERRAIVSKEELLNKLTKVITDGDAGAAGELALEVLVAGIAPLEAIQQGATKGLDIIGERFQRLEVYLPELIKAGQAMKACLAVLTPHINRGKEGGVKLGKVVIGTVPGDIHDIGKSMVATMLSVSGFEVYDLGTDVPVKRFAEKAEEVQAKVIAMSSLLTMSAYYQEELIIYLKDAGLRKKYYVVVGGAPVSPQWATEIGADGYGKTAIDASHLLKRLVTENVSPPLPQPLVFQ